jgi:hypothetical protein
MIRFFGSAAVRPVGEGQMSRLQPLPTSLRLEAAVGLALAPLAALAPPLPVAPTWSFSRRNFTKPQLAAAIECGSIYVALRQAGWERWEAYVVAMAIWAVFGSDR